MTKEKHRKILIPLGVSALSMFALAAQAQAPIDDDVRSQLEEIAQSASAAEDSETPRTYADIVDEYARRATDRLDNSNIIEQQSRINEEILLLQRQKERAEAISQLVDYLGSDAFRKMYPDLAASLENSPMLLNAEKQRADLELSIKTTENQIANIGVEDAETGGQSSMEVITEDGELNPAIAEIVRSMIEERDAQVEERIQAAREEAAQEVFSKIAERSQIFGAHQVDPDTMEPDNTLSLREIYGSGGKFTAVILNGDERTRVYEGDILSNGGEVEKINENSLVIRLGDELQTLKLRK